MHVQQNPAQQLGLATLTQQVPLALWFASLIPSRGLQLNATWLTGQKHSRPTRKSTSIDTKSTSTKNEIVRRTDIGTEKELRNMERIEKRIGNGIAIVEVTGNTSEKEVTVTEVAKKPELPNVKTDVTPSKPMR